MNWLVEWVHTPLAVGVGWGLLHFVWEGALVALALAVLLRANRRASATLRYGLACAAMAAMAAAFAVTVANLIPTGEARFVVVTPYGPGGDAWASLPATPVNWTQRLTAILPACLPWVVSAWLAGVFLFYFRTLSGWIAVKRLSTQGVRAVPPPWEQRLSRLTSWLKVRQPVRILESCLADTPVVIGWLRPVILVPASMLTTLTPGQIESILAHELAHIRRHDYLVNLLQRMVEGLLFYHPAVWWVSAQIRAERENCCDDVAVAACGDVHGYASALATLEQDRWGTSETALAARGGNLMKRIRRLLRQTEGPQFGAPPLLAAALFVAVVGVALAAWQTPAKTIPLETPYRKWLNEDVVYIISKEEREAFQRLRADEEREKFIEQFWLRRDPTPGTAANERKEEHYRRIAYSNELYAGPVPGWRSDRGRIYIVYGPPDEIESHPSPTQGPPREAWRYHWLEGLGRNVDFEFTDPSRNGKFDLWRGPLVNRPR